ncbi:MAG TPA: hypothetical protein VN905_11425 [Candidatus Binatia bacterium]|nr:hypothetical protein [Candidatus Binatia bacterium]
MIDTESGRPKARARTVRRWIVFIAAVVIVAAGTALIWVRLLH